MTEGKMDIHARSLIEIQRDPDSQNWEPGIRAHVGECAECARTAEASQLLRERLAERGRVRAPDTLVASLRRAAAEREPAPAAPRATRPSGPLPTRWAAPLAMAAGLVFGLLLRPALEGLQPGGSDEVPRSVAEYMDDVTHDRYLFDRLGRPIEVTMSDPAEASQWLSSGLNLDIDVPPSPGDWEMQGLRVWHTVGRLAALVVYDDPSGERIAVTAVPLENMSFDDIAPTSTSAGDFYAAEGWGHQGVIWQEGIWAWSAVAPLPPQELLDWAVAYRGRGAAN